MDEFGVLVESMGFKAHGKSSAPLADLKATNKTNSNKSFPPDIAIHQSKSRSTYNSVDLDAVFGSKPQNPPLDDDDVFGYGLMMKTSSSNNNYNDNDDVFGLMKTTSANPIHDDLLGGASVIKSNQQTASDLLSDFTPSLHGRKSEANSASQPAKSFSTSAEDPFGIFERQQGSSYKVNYGASVVDDYLDSLFSSSNRSNTRLSQSPTTEDSVYDALFNNSAVPKQQNKASSVSLNSKKQASSKANITDDFSYLFGMGVSPPSGEFQEVEGESEERRKARFNHHMTTRERMNNALNEKNKRDLQAQQEQDEKHRVAATLDGDIRRWAVGKEGNLRALLSSLQHVLWTGSGWQPISLTDLITSTAVKKAYYKATLCVHPDKVQQKGASVQQKYIAEKVFDLLKEAWNKFNAQEFKKH